MKENEWVISEEMVDYFQERLRIITKAEGLLSMPNTEFATMEMVAEYYEVDIYCIGSVTYRHRDEFAADGVRRYAESEVRSILRPNEIEIPISGLILYPQKAIRTVGMLLQDSAIAQEFRVQSLNNIEQAN